MIVGIEFSEELEADARLAESPEPHIGLGQFLERVRLAGLDPEGLFEVPGGSVEIAALEGIAPQTRPAPRHRRACARGRRGIAARPRRTGALGELLGQSETGRV